MAQNGLTEDSTGDLICCGYSVFTPGAGQTYRTNVPIPGFRRNQRNIPNMHRWNGATYIEVPQPAITTCHTSASGNTLRAEMDSDEDSDQAAGNEHKWELWDGDPDAGGVVAFKVSVVNNVVTLSTPLAGGISFGDVQIDSLGVGIAPNGVSGEAIFNARVIVGTVATPAAPIHVECQSDSEGIRLMRSGVASQYLSLSEGAFGQHLIEAFGTKHLDIKNRSTAGDMGIRFYTQNVYRWQIDANGHWVTGVDNAVDVGTSGAIRPRTMYLGTALNVGSPVVSTGVGHIRAGDGTRLLKWDAATGGLDVTGAGASLGVGAAATGNRGDAKFSDGTRTLIYNAALGYLYQSGSQLVVGTNTNHNLVFFTNNINRIKIQADGRLAWMTDNSLDIGQSGAQRPAVGYFGTALNVGDGVVVTVVNGSINAGDGTRSFAYDAAVGSLTLVTGIGQDKGVVLKSSTANNTIKDARFVYGHYDTSEENIAVFGGDSRANSSALRFGGGYGVQNAVTTIYFYTAANNRTLSGTIRWFIQSTGHLLAGGGTNNHDIGSAGTGGAAGRVRNCWIQTGLYVGVGTTTLTTGMLHCDNGTNDMIYNAATGTLTIGGTGTGILVVNNAATINGDLNHAGTKSAVNGSTPTAKQTVGGSRGGNAALATLLTALDTFGVISDATTA